MTSESVLDNAPTPRRGRPQQFPHDPSPIKAGTVGVQQRVSWLLATSRVLSGDPMVVSRERFLEQLHGRGMLVDSSRISRWEAGVQRVRDNVIEAYESVLGLPATSVVALAANLRRANGIEQEASHHEEDDGVLDGLFDRAMHDTMSGSDWMGLATRVTEFEHFYLTPEMRTALCDKLLRELQVSAGHAQVTRTAAANLLMGKPTFQRQMAQSLGAYVLNSDAQVFRPVMHLLRQVGDDPSSDLVLRLMSDRRTIIARAASSMVAVKLGRGHYVGQSLLAIEEHVLRGLTTPTRNSPMLDALDLVSQLSQRSFDRISVRIVDRTLRGRVQLIRETGELQSPDLIHEAARDIAHVAQAGNPAPFAQEPDLMLVRLVREALFHAHRQRREHAIQILAASHYRPAIASMCLEAVSCENAFVAARAWDVMQRMGPVSSAELVGLALNEPRRDPQVRALFAIGGTSGPLDENDADAVVELAWHGLPEVQHAATYALGMTGSSGLERLIEHPASSQRRAARWWRTFGPAVTDA